MVCPMDQRLELVRARQLGLTGAGRRIRQQAGLSLREMADWVGVDASTLLRWETGESAPSQRNARGWVSVVAQLTAELAMPWPNGKE